MITREEILKVLEDVKDPEIPTISIVDLGIVTEVNVDNESNVFVTLTPTFAGCPALKMIENLVESTIRKLDVKSVNVKTTFDTAWNTNMITEKGREMLKKHGLAPPPKHNGLVQIKIIETVECPYCGSNKTSLNSLFGPTLCRSIHYCDSCLQSFEQFKPVV